MTIRNVTRVLLDREIKRAQGEDSHKSPKEEKLNRSANISVDSAQISPEAKEIHAAYADNSAISGSAIKNDKALNNEEIKSRIQSGYYNSPEVLEEIASSIISSEELTRNEEENDRFKSIKSNINSGFYDTQEVIETVASRLLEFLK